MVNEDKNQVNRSETQRDSVCSLHARQIDIDYSLLTGAAWRLDFDDKRVADEVVYTVQSHYQVHDPTVNDNHRRSRTILLYNHIQNTKTIPILYAVKI